MPGKPSGLADRLKKIVPPVDTIWRNEVEFDPTGLAPANLKPRAKIGGVPIAFLGRMIFSCLVDADFFDTGAFYSSVDGRQGERGWPVLSDEIARMIARFDAPMLSKRRGD